MFAGVMVDLTRMDLEAEAPGLPGTQDSAGQQQSSAVAGTPHKAGVPIAAIAGAAAGGLAAMLIGMSYSAAPPKGKEKKRKCKKKGERLYYTFQALIQRGALTVYQAAHLLHYCSTVLASSAIMAA